LPDEVLNERRRHAVKLREAGITVRETVRQRELSTHTIVVAHKAFRLRGWAAVKVRRTGRLKGSDGQRADRSVFHYLADRAQYWQASQALEIYGAEAAQESL
jgi:hypothetical protein